MDWPYSLPDVWDGARLTSDMKSTSVLRRWWNPREGYAPRVTWWQEQGQEGGRLRIEFSIPKLACIDPLDNVTEAEKDQALDAATVFVQAKLDARLPDVATWRVSRVDYAWNWDLHGDLPAYLAMVGRLWLGDSTRHPYPETLGVVWKSKREHARWVKFYDKTRELGRGDLRNVLRFEVSNYKRVLPYMCARWFGCEQTVGEVLQPGRALYALAVAWERLGLGRAERYAQDGDALLLELRSEFGQSASSAYYALRVIEQYGADAHKVYGLMSSNTYYRWRRLLARYLAHDNHVLIPLHLPTQYVFTQTNESVKAQNLEDRATAGREDTQKILWQKIAQNLRLTAAQRSEYLISRWTEYAAA